ncbi:hypothetical protein ACFVVU_36215 [Kitasatospora sp. NPDC057965]|uniref:hypothetical protein n=1 Tax=Kitasatospora sp. NPDC057965 TaxID=3346291 RepID=UPI0036D82919
MLCRTGTCVEVEGELVADDDQVLVQFALPVFDAEEPLTAEAAEDLADARPERTTGTYDEHRARVGELQAGRRPAANSRGTATW